MSPARVPIVPGIATTGEQGLAGVEATVWNGFFLPKGTPRPIVRRMNEALGETMSRPDMRGKLQALGLSIVPPEQRTPEYLAGHLPREIERWGKVIRASSISMD
jgi:tripartite-type tricarboxylate transporter receptor subunit TctC